MRSLPRGLSPPEAMEAAVSSSSVSKAGSPLEERPSFLGEFQHANAAFEESQSEAGLEIRDPARQGRLRSPGRSRGASEPAVPGDEIEVSEGEQVHAFHGRDGLSKDTACHSECGSLISGCLQANPE